MKSSSISTLGLTVLLVTAPALQANESENSSWLAPFSTTFLYSAIGISTGYIAYKLYSNYTNSSELDVIAPWYEEERTIETPTLSIEAQTPSQENKAVELSVMDGALPDILESCVTLFVEAYGPQLVTVHLEIANPDLSEEDRKELECVRTQLEAQAPPFAQTIPPLMVGLALLTVAQEQLLEQSTSPESTKGSINSEYVSLINTIDALSFYIRTFVETYGDSCQADLMTEFSDQLQKESYEQSQTIVD